MGASQSTPQPAFSDDKMTPYTSNTRAKQSASELLASLTLKDRPAATASITLDQISDWNKDAMSLPQSRLAQTTLHKADILSSMISRQATVDNIHLFNVKLSTENDLVSNQKSSGRCWLFAMTNMIRLQMTRKYNLDKGFELSQSYLFFWDSLSKANWFLENMIDLADKDLNDHVVQYLLAEPQNDGGQWDMEVNLVQHFGLVPQHVFPESWNSSNSSKLDAILTSKLREYTLELRSLYNDALRSLQDVQTKTVQEKRALAQSAVRKRKQEQMSEVYRILAISCGTPPQPNEPFTWEYYTKDKKYHKVTSTPKDFARDYCLIDVSKSISLIHDPRNKHGLYTVERLGNVVGGRPVLYVNTSIDDLKNVAIKLLQSDTPVWFGCDVGKSYSSALGILDPNLYDLEQAFGTSVKMTKEQRIASGDSSMTHAMVLTGVHLNDKGEPVRWRVENSWGPEACKEGYFVMTDKWFEENVFQIVADRTIVPSRLRKVFESNNPTVLPCDDAFGSLATSTSRRCLGVI
ncbi:bleomycin hydrolase [Microbotryomycetes sp. JL221]|nr:bleomycin hydrolase [Microbotryomycetes sp. JL221]